MAYVYQTTSGSWAVQIERKGFPRVNKATFDTKKQATSWANDVESKMDRGTYVDRSEAESTTLYDALGTY